MTPRTLCVLICTHNRVDLLGKTLASLNAAERPSGWQIEILVIANACSDATHEFLNNYQHANDGRFPLRWHAEPKPGKSNALNFAMPLVAGEVVAFVDDDHRVDPTYLAEICRAAEAYPEADLFCGRILPDWDGTEPDWVHDDGPYRVYPLPVPRFDLGPEPRELTMDIAVPGGGNLFLRQPWLNKVGPFATDFGPVGHNLGGAEDLEWVIRALRLGARLQYVTSVVQHHYVDGARLTLPYLMQKAFVRSASTVRLDKTQSGGVPRYMYRKLLGYFFSALTALGTARRRFYLVRLAAALGEARGYQQNRHAKSGQA
jgi:glycosyltransferase involved in cell wall biosynthesis